MSSVADRNAQGTGPSDELGRGTKREREEASLGETQFVEGDLDEDDDEDAPTTGKDSKRAGRRKIKIEYIQDKSRRHITFSKRKAGIMKKAYELSTLTGTQVLLLVVSETGLVYTFTTPKLQPLVTKQEGKNLIQACLNAPDASSAENASPNRQAGHQGTQGYPGSDAPALEGNDQYDRKDINGVSSMAAFKASAYAAQSQVPNMPAGNAATAAGANYASLANLQYNPQYSSALAAGNLNAAAAGNYMSPQGYPQYGGGQHGIYSAAQQQAAAAGYPPGYWPGNNGSGGNQGGQGIAMPPNVQDSNGGAGGRDKKKK